MFAGSPPEVIGGVLVLHRPNEAERKELEGKLAIGGEDTEGTKAYCGDK